MKKLFTLIALLAVVMGVKAEWVEDYKIDYSQNTGFPFFVMGYVPEWVDGVMTDYGANFKYVATTKDDGSPADETSDVIVKTQGGAEYYKISLDAPEWHQYFIADNIRTEIDGAYTIKAMVKASEACTINVNMGWGWGNGELASATVDIPTEWTEVEWEYTGIGGASCNLVAQPGTVTATIEWKYVTVSHFQKEQRPVEWIEDLTNGDAEKSWEELGLADVKFNDQENNFKVCAWSKERMRNMNEAGDGWDPFPADIEEVDGSRVFVCHAQPAITDGGASAWDNQFWIQSPQSWKAGTQIKVHFRYKASQDVSSTDTQIHKQNPSDYLIWHAIGNIHFTTEWQEFDDVMTIAEDMAGGWSIAFNLNSVVKDAVTFYFDDLSWQHMKLDEGYFVAGANPSEGIDYDLDNAAQFEYSEEDGFYVATVGDKKSYVSQIMISTIRGNDAAFKGATLKPAGEIENNPEKWLDYTPASLAKLNLPGAGIWKVYLDDAYKKMAFEMLEGDIIEKPEINPNPTVVTINALERDFTNAEQEGGTGQAWDNQFWIVANRPLAAGETTIVQFKYKSAIPAKASTQSHEMPGNYIHWAAIGDVNFTEEWQDFNATFTVPAECDGTMADGGFLKNLQSIAFNLSEIKDANTYELKDIVWKLEDGTESLINQTGSENFFVKVLGGNPEMFNDGTGISSVVNNSTVPTVTYNIAGQRVSKGYKGIVINNGRKVLVK